MSSFFFAERESEKRYHPNGNSYGGCQDKMVVKREALGANDARKGNSSC